MSTFIRSERSHRRLQLQRRLTRFPLHCEGLESRQLLSVAPTSLVPNVVTPVFNAPAQVSNSPIVVSTPTPGTLQIQFEFGTTSGLTFVTITFGGISGSSGLFGTGQTGSAPAQSFGPGLGTLAGITGSGLTSSSGLDNTPGSLFTGTTSTIGSTNSINNSAITPLNPNLTSIAPTPGLNPVYVVPPPVQPVVVHMTASASPVTNIAFSSLLSAVEEQPTGITHFGQELHFPRNSRLVQPIEEPQPASLIDVVEPPQPVVPVDGEKLDGGQPANEAPAPGAARSRTLLPLTDADVAALLDLGSDSSQTSLADRSQAESDDPSSGTYYSWSLSTVFGATMVAAGGYQLAIREADRFKARWTPRWIGAERPNKRKSGLSR